MKTDRELLELSAKAAGIVSLRWGLDDPDRQISGEGQFIGATWNPLTDDGDVARLEVACELQIDIGDIGVISERADGIACFEPYANNGGDRNLSRRRASVRAAAEIGAAMP